MQSDGFGEVRNRSLPFGTLQASAGEFRHVAFGPKPIRMKEVVGLLYECGQLSWPFGPKVGLHELRPKIDVFRAGRHQRFDQWD